MGVMKRIKNMICRTENIGGVTVKITKKSNLKNLYLRVKPPAGDVNISAPLSYPDDKIRLFVLEKMPEIISMQSKIISQLKQNKREYISGESHYLWGTLYPLELRVGAKGYSVKKTPNKLVFLVPNNANVYQKEKAFNEWYRRELKLVLESMIPNIEKRMGICANEYRIKNMKTRWGTCNIHQKRIWINLQLAKKPRECLEYVLVHEMVHLWEKNHTHKFYSLVEKYYPTWKNAKKILDNLR